VVGSAYTPSDKNHERAEHVLRQIFAGEHQVYMPFTALTEVVCKLSNILLGHGKDPDLAVSFGDLLPMESSINWVSVDREFAYDAAMFGRLHRLRGMDALYAYTAFKFNCELLTTDNDFFKSANKAIKVRHLGELK
jgi:predicted nucleic acid-binding protein